MKIYTIIGVWGDVDTTTYGSFISLEKACAEADRIDHELNAEFYADADNLGDDLNFVIWERGTVISVLESDLDLSIENE